MKRNTEYKTRQKEEKQEKEQFVLITEHFYTEF